MALLVRRSKDSYWTPYSKSKLNPKSGLWCVAVRVTQTAYVTACGERIGRGRAEVVEIMAPNGANLEPGCRAELYGPPKEA